MSIKAIMESDTNIYLPKGKKETEKKIQQVEKPSKSIYKGFNLSSYSMLNQTNQVDDTLIVIQYKSFHDAVLEYE